MSTALNNGPRSSALILLIFAAVLMSGCQFTDLRAVYFNNATSKKLKEKSMDENQTGYMKALEIEPLLPAVHSNLGSTYDVLKDPDRAMKLYKNAEEYSKIEIENLEKQPIHAQWERSALYTTLFASLFNQGQLLARENKIDDALKKYQDALALNSESIEVKTNIELLMQQKKGGGKGEGESKDNKDSDKDSKGKDKKDGESKDDDKDQDKQGSKPKDYSGSPKYKPRDFKGELTKENVSKIFGEISQQEKKMRAQFSKQNQTKESPRDKDW
jgi:tetratricopeptide (TPR) repeat protein